MRREGIEGLEDSELAQTVSQEETYPGEQPDLVLFPHCIGVIEIVI